MNENTNDMHSPGQAARQRRLAALSLAPAGRLAEALAVLPPLPEHRFLRRPESGLVMVRGRLGNTGHLFNLGEMLVTRCTVECRGILGHGWVAGAAPEAAELAARADALAQMPEYASALAALVDDLEAERAERAAFDAAETEATRVRFFTMVRGEDKDDE